MAEDLHMHIKIILPWHDKTHLPAFQGWKARVLCQQYTYCGQANTIVKGIESLPK